MGDSPAAGGVIHSLRRSTGALARPTGDVFATGKRPAGHLRGYRKPFQHACTLAGIPGACAHDLRRTAASMMASLGVSRSTLGRILNHADRSVTAVYDRYSYDAEKRAALERLADHLQNTGIRA